MPVEPSIPTMPDPGEIHLWTVPCAGADDAADELLSCLSERERLRTARMTDRVARSAFVIGRARVRQILGAYVGQPAAALDVVGRERGKPVLADAPSWFDFSFSRCARLHVCAIAVNRRVGTDVECLASERDADAIAATCFTPEERAWVTAHAPSERAGAFAAIWVKKEAFVKAVGAGPRLPLDVYHVPREDEGWVEGPDLHTDAGPWRVRAFRPSSPPFEDGTVVGAVVAEGDWRLTQFPWPGNRQETPRAHAT